MYLQKILGQSLYQKFERKKNLSYSVEFEVQKLEAVKKYITLTAYLVNYEKLKKTSVFESYGFNLKPHFNR